MEIELPDGTVLEAPDDADIKSVVRGYHRTQLKSSNPAEYDEKSPEWAAKYGPTASSDAHPSNSLAEGIGSGMIRMNRGLTNVGTKVMNKHPFFKMFGGIPTQDFASDDSIRQQDALDKPLSDTTGGSVGQAIGQSAVAAGATAPLGAAGAVGRGGSLLARTLGAGGRAALEGGVTGAGAAPVDEQKMGAAQGAGLGLTMQGLFAGGGRAIRGIVNKSDAAKNLEQIAGQHGEEIFVPISQAASEGDTVSRLAKTFYAEGLPFVPGVKGQLKRQSEQAAAGVRGIALKEATPDGVTLPKDAGSNVGEAMHTLKGGFDQAYDDTVKGLDWLVPQNFAGDVEGAIRSAHPRMDNTSVSKAVDAAHELMQRFSNGGARIEGSNLLTVKNQLSALARMAPGHEKGAYIAAQDVIDDMIQPRLSVQGLADKYNNLSEPYRHFVGLNKAAKAARANGGNFNMNQLANKATDPAQLDLAQQAGAVLKNPVAGTSFTGRGLLGGAGLGGVAAAGSPAAAVIGFLGGNAMATKTFQKALLGDTSSQRTLAQIIEKHPDAAAEIGRLMKIMAAQQAGDSDE